MDKQNDVVLVTGATGRQGGAVARQLLSRGYKVKAMTRRPEGEKAKSLASLSAEVVQADLDDPGLLEKALAGVWGVFAVQDSREAGVTREEEQGKRLAELAKENGVTTFVYTSVASAERKTGVPHFDNKGRIEETVRSLGFPYYTILRPAFIMETLMSPDFFPGLLEGRFWPIKPETKLQMVAVDDIAWFALRAFEQPEEMNGVAVDLATDERSFPEMAEILSNAIGRKIGFVPMDVEEYADYLKIPREDKELREYFTTAFPWFDEVNWDVDIPALGKKYGIHLTTFPEWAAANASYWQ